MPFFSNLLSLEFRVSGFPWLLRHTLQKKKTTILMFHHPDVEFFDQTLTALKKRYNIIPFSLFLRSLSDQTIKLPTQSLILTFDDGWISNFELLPVLQKHKTPVTIFLMAGIADTMHHPWFFVTKDRALKESLKKCLTRPASQHLNDSGLKRVGNLKKESSSTGRK